MDLDHGTTVSLCGRPVSRMGYGAMQLTHGGRVGPDAAAAVLRRAVDLGVNHIDTSWFYGAGACNALVRTALAPFGGDLVVGVKLGVDNAPDGSLIAAQHPSQLRSQVEDNLTSLGTERLELAYLRRLDVAPGIVAEGEQRVDIDAQLAELMALRDEGKIGAIGLSHVDAAQVRHAAPIGIAAVQNGYNVLERAAEPVLDECRRSEIAWVPYFPLGSGFADRRRVTDDATVIAIAEELDVTASQVGLAWLLAHERRTVLIPGTVSIAHLEQNMAAADLELGEDALARLDALGQ
ncbi:aldo/keto reductase [Microbacterium sp. ARD32]|uniref:aldo/keto reductase n=1 Tax=Microbacterium sp. ARD32 TaxID=2962577 RepID=UPI0028824EF2|nr:aldo/keto reductase [Microbacterium sp. ARD32]MDT0158466.1 aldo/keto reductase [Microbacterium sp. ARD32]